MYITRKVHINFYGEGGGWSFPFLNILIILHGNGISYTCVSQANIQGFIHMVGQLCTDKLEVGFDKITYCSRKTDLFMQNKSVHAK